MAPSLSPESVAIVGDDARRVRIVDDFDKDGLGVRTTGREPDPISCYDALAPYAQRDCSCA